MGDEPGSQVQALLVRGGTMVWLAVGIVVLAAAGRSLLPRAAVTRSPVTMAVRPPVEAPRPADSTTAAYQPRAELTSGRERVMIFIGASFCGADREPGFPAVVERAKTTLQRQALASGARFRAIAVSLDWSPDTALAFLEPFGRWDEMSIGGNWANDAALRYLWAGAPSPAVPQIVLLEREMTVGDRVSASPPRELRRLVGTVEIRRWVDSGAPN